MESYSYAIIITIVNQEKTLGEGGEQPVKNVLTSVLLACHKEIHVEHSHF